MNKTTLAETILNADKTYQDFRDKFSSIADSADMAILDSLIEKASCLDFMLGDPSDRTHSLLEKNPTAMVMLAASRDYETFPIVTDKDELLSVIKLDKQAFINRDKVISTIYEVPNIDSYRAFKEVVEEAIHKGTQLPTSVVELKIVKGYGWGAYHLEVITIDGVPICLL